MTSAETRDLLRRIFDAAVASEAPAGKTQVPVSLGGGS